MLMPNLKISLNYSINYLLFMVLKILLILFNIFFFFLLTGKTISIYKYVFSNLLDKISELKYNFEPNIIYADFERAIHSSVSNIFHKFIRKDCPFHLGQSIWKKI